VKGKNLSKKKKHKLEVEADYSFKIIGIASHEIDYKFIWVINQVLDLNFIKQDDLVVFNKKLKSDQSFSLYSAEDENNQLQFNIISNRSADGYFAEEISNFDYFLQIIGELSSENRDALIKKLKTADIVLAAIKIDPNCLISKPKFIF